MQLNRNLVIGLGWVVAYTVSVIGTAMLGTLVGLWIIGQTCFGHA